MIITICNYINNTNLVYLRAVNVADVAYKVKCFKAVLYFLLYFKVTVEKGGHVAVACDYVEAQHITSNNEAQFFAFFCFIALFALCCNTDTIFPQKYFITS